MTSTSEDPISERPPSEEPTSEDLLSELSEDLTHLLLAWSQGDSEALEALMPLVCDDLRAMARRHMSGESDRHELQPTALVNEFFLRIQKHRIPWENRRHFFAFAGQAMRNILVDLARAQKRQKRGGERSLLMLGLELDEISGTEAPPHAEILALHEALDQLEAKDPQAASVVKLRYFVGMTVAETAAALGISTATVKREWRFAQLWLFRELQEDPDSRA